MFSNLKKIAFISWEEIAFKLTFCCMCMLITCTIHLHCQTLEKNVWTTVLFLSAIMHRNIASLGLGSTVGLAKKVENWVTDSRKLFCSRHFNDKLIAGASRSVASKACLQALPPSPSPDYDSTCFACQFCDVT